MRVSPEQFEQWVWEAVDELPEPIRNRIANLDIEVVEQPTLDDLKRMKIEHPRDLFGLYRGVPLTQRTTHYEMVAPDLITIFQRAHERACHTPEQMRAQIRRTVRHEIAHHFGISDERLEELGAY